MPRYLTLPEISERLRLSTGRVRQLVREGRIPAVQATPRGKLLFDEAEVIAVLRRDAEPAGAGPGGN
jgi:excisionase family DNA binding protein